MVKKNLNIVIIISMLILTVIFGNYYDSIKYEYLESSYDKYNSAQIVSNAEFEVRGVNENMEVYSYENKPEVIDLYVTVNQPSKKSKSHAGFNTVNNTIDVTDYKYEQKFDMIFQHGENQFIPKGNYGYGEKSSNGTIEIRGHSTRGGDIKSYKIRLAKKSGTWEGQSIINLNKHPFDITRVRNKLSFDYFKMIPDITSLRTQFVNLYVKDLTSTKKTSEFKNYGLYTYVEQPNKRFLLSHGLDPNASLYKAEDFEFFRYEDKILNEKSPKFNRGEFESVLEIKIGTDHSKMINMLEKVNDYTIDIDTVIEEHFDKKNYLTWLATSILFGNRDTNAQKFYLYSPTNSKKWYFLPWDYDGAWGYSTQNGGKIEDKLQWQIGISNYWGAILHKRFFKNPKNLEALNKKIEELGTIINEENTKMLLDSYYGLISPIIKRGPDVYTLDATIEQFEKDYERLKTLTDVHKKQYYDYIERPMPIFIGDPIKISETEYKIDWDRSYDLQGDDIYYNVKVADNLAFENPIAELEQSEINNIKFKVKNNGVYYIRVITIDSKGNKQKGFNFIRDNNGVYHYGVFEFFIE